jgi:hypothetical protein
MAFLVAWVGVMKNELALQSKYLALLLIAIVLSALSVSFSGDCLQYIGIFNLDKGLSFSELLAKYSYTKEPLFHVVLKALSFIAPARPSLFILVFCSILIKFIYLHKINKFNFALMFYILFFATLFDGTLIRAGIATTLVVYSFYMLIQKKHVAMVLALVIATQVHLSSIIFLLLMPIYFYFPIRKLVAYVFYLSPCVLILHIDLSAILIGIFSKANHRYLEYSSLTTNQNSSGLYYFYSWFMFGLVIYISRKLIQINKLSMNNGLQEPFIELCNVITLVGVSVLFLLHTNVAIASRISDLLLLPIVFTLSHVFNVNKVTGKTLENKLLLSMLIAYGLVGFIKVFYWGARGNPPENQLFHFVLMNFS